MSDITRLEHDIREMYGLRGTVLFCQYCQARTAHLTAPEGVPICGYCGCASVDLGDDDEK